MQNQDAETLAIRALGWIAQDDDIMHGFLGFTGADLSDLKTRASDPEFLGFVLDYLLTNDEFVIGFTDWANCSREDPMIARARLPGGDIPNWT